MEWTTRDELRAAQRRDQLDAKLGGHQKAELSRIYLNPGGRPGQKQGPRVKRMFIPLPATTQAATALGLQGPGVMVQRDGERSGHLEGGVLIARHPPLERPFVQRVNVDMSAMALPMPPPGGAPPAHARSCSCPPPAPHSPSSMCCARCALCMWQECTREGALNAGVTN